MALMNNLFLFIAVCTTGLLLVTNVHGFNNGESNDNNVQENELSLDNLTAEDDENALAGNNDDFIRSYLQWIASQRTVSDEDVDEISDQKRLSRSFFGMRGKKAGGYNFYGARGKRLTPRGFFGARGKKSTEDEARWLNVPVVARASHAGFFGVRGKKSPAASFYGARGRRVIPGFFGARGKKYSNTGFFGARGKRFDPESYEMIRRDLEDFQKTVDFDKAVKFLNDINLILKLEQ